MNNVPIIDMPIYDTKGNPVDGEKREAILNWL